MADETSKRWLAVLIAGVTLLVAIATLLQNHASGQAALYNRRSQEAAFRSSGALARGQQRVAFDLYNVLVFGDELFSYAVRNGSTANDAIGQAYLEARNALTPLSPLLRPEYSQFAENGLRHSTLLGQYEAETYVVDTRLYDEHRNAYARAGNQWNAQADAYVAIIAILAVSLFLFALASTLGGAVRALFVFVGMGLGTLATLWMLLIWLSPVNETPDAALRYVAEGAGHAVEATHNVQASAVEYYKGYNASWQKAIDADTKALELDPTYAAAHNLRGIARMMIQPAQAAAAAADFENALANGKSEYGVYWNLGIARYYNGEYSAAVAASRAAIGLNPAICGPHFTAALAILAQGQLDEAQREYEAGIARCDEIYQDAVQHNQRPPVSLWTHMQDAVDEVDKLLCVIARRHCYPDRNLPSVNVVNAAALTTPTEQIRKRLKEALTALEFQGKTQVTPKGASWSPLEFVYPIVDPNESNAFLNYAEKDVFPYSINVPEIDTISNFQNTTPDDFVVWKVFRDGYDELGLRYAANWNLETSGQVVKPISSWYVLAPGTYVVEVYVNGELVTDGAFEISVQPVLVNPLPEDAKPVGNVQVGGLLFADNFDNNYANWQTGIPSAQQDGDVDGALTIVTRAPNAAFNSGCTQCGPYRNFYYEVEASLHAGPEDFGYGLTFRSQVNHSSLYAFTISNNGHYNVSRYDSAATSLIPWTPSAAIRQGESNVLGVLCRDARCEFYINGEQVNAIEDDTLTGQFVGVRVDNTDVQASFDNVRVWSVE